MGGSNFGECDGASYAEAAPRCPGGTHPSAEGPGEPSEEERPDPEALLETASRTTDVRPLGLFKELHHHSGRPPPEQNDISWRPPDAVKEEDRGQRKPWGARNQEGACAEAGHTLESVATPGEYPELDWLGRKTVTLLFIGTCTEFNWCDIK
ncbi:hypothetical protein NDU88_005108 [Pleurodeles waltl]|uniref:Uncharacterized protein n=1 Tax=Pleurodeles waltl TaxID=8319 RepID=A0AAV7SKR4_PLEWA|nr:hypothetical protein NDU88_005108 [Pleurodeles waltl]